MALKILCAGCPPDEKERAESDVRRALGRRAEAEVWMVSLVKLQGRWSVTLDGPATRGLTCVAPDGRITESIVEALGPAPAPPTPPPSSVPAPAPAPSPVTVPAAKPAAAATPPTAFKFAASTPPPPAPPPPAPAAAPVGPGSRQDRHQCASCSESFLVLYESQGDEGEETVAVACPHCWHRNYVLVAESAAESRDFTAEKG